MENIIQILLISIIQGIAEFIPVSSSAHINLLSNLFNYEKIELAINVSAHFGSLVAVLFYFNKEIYNFSKNKNLFYKVIIASIPIFIIGYILIELKIISNLRTIEIMGWTTIIFGILLYISDKFKIKLKMKNNFTFRNAIIIGFYQTLALIPGVSRSGIIITGARFLKFNRIDAAKISFLLSIPALGAWSLYGCFDLIKQNDQILTVSSILTAFLSFIFSYITIKYFLIYLKKFNLNLFVIYRLILGIILLSVVYLK
jgi:undecaprenyl-diphosphatase